MVLAALPFAQTVALGAIAGVTIFIGLPVGRVRALDTRARVALAMFSVGILAFIFMDVGSHAEAIIEGRLGAFKHGHGSFAGVVGLFALLVAGFTTGSVGITLVERALRRRRAALPPLAGGALEPSGAGAEVAAAAPAGRTSPGVTVLPDGPRTPSAQATSFAASRRAHPAGEAAPGSRAGMVPAGAGALACGPGEVAALGARDAAAMDLEAAQARARVLQTGMTVATAIGLHNFAEGLAIGVSAATGAVGLATVLVIGFAAHNATEGFGIVGPLGDARPSWRWLAAAGIVGGGPTFLGTIVGYQVTSAPLELLFYALAAGALIYVIGEIWTAMRRHGHRELALALLACGFLAGVLTDLIVSYGGA
jgi:ZIP family zinc transporter